MSSGVLAELNRVNRSIGGRFGQNRIVTDIGMSSPFDETREQRGWYIGAAGVRADCMSAVNCFVADLPFQRYNEQCEREYEAMQAAGGREVCPHCGVRAVKSSDVKTVGVPTRSHPGDEYSVYRKCGNCDWAEL